MPVGGIVGGAIGGAIAITAVLAFTWYKVKTHRQGPETRIDREWIDLGAGPDTRTSQIYTGETGQASKESGQFRPSALNQSSGMPSSGLRYPDTVPSANLSSE